MREIGFSEKWGKLNSDILFTTYRFARKDKDWQVEEVVKVVYKPRSPKEREVLGVARIIRKEVKDLNQPYYYYGASSRISPEAITPEEAYEDGFTGMHGGGDIEKMKSFFHEAYGYWRCHEEKMNKLTLYWISKEPELQAGGK